MTSGTIIIGDIRDAFLFDMITGVAPNELTLPVSATHTCIATYGDTSPWQLNCSCLGGGVPSPVGR
jgi:hypothetical protein